MRPFRSIQIGAIALTSLMTVIIVNKYNIKPFIVKCRTIVYTPQTPENIKALRSIQWEELATYATQI